MDVEHLRAYCLSKPHTTESTPFDHDTLVFKVHNKMYCLCSIGSFTGVNVKCEPEIAEELRAEYIAVEPGFHMNKKHWNTVKINQDVDDTHLLKMVDDSYNLIFASLPKKVKESS